MTWDSGCERVEGMKNSPARFVLRVPPALHARLAEEAAKEGVSLNTFVVMVMARSQGFHEGLEYAERRAGFRQNAVNA